MKQIVKAAQKLIRVYKPRGFGVGQEVQALAKAIGDLPKTTLFVNLLSDTGAHHGLEVQATVMATSDLKRTAQDFQVDWDQALSDLRDKEGRWYNPEWNVNDVEKHLTKHFGWRFQAVKTIEVEY